MNTTVDIYGRIIFDPKNMTRKHRKQSCWKKVAIVDISGEWCNYYGWFLAKRGLTLNTPLRGAHVTFINDASIYINGDSQKEKYELWSKVKKVFHKKKVTFSVGLSPKTDGKHWWLRVTPDSCGELQAIRNILGMGQPNWEFHLTIGYANERNTIQSQYLKTLISNKLI